MSAGEESVEGSLYKSHTVATNTPSHYFHSHSDSMSHLPTTHPQSLTPLASSSRTTHHNAFFALPVCALNS